MNRLRATNIIMQTENAIGTYMTSYESVILSIMKINITICFPFAPGHASEKVSKRDRAIKNGRGGHSRRFWTFPSPDRTVLYCSHDKTQTVVVASRPDKIGNPSPCKAKSLRTSNSQPPSYTEQRPTKCNGSWAGYDSDSGAETWSFHNMLLYFPIL